MVKKTLLILVLLSAIKMNSQTVNIPDANFLAALISEGVDTNNNGTIQTSEAQAVNSLDIQFKSISDLTGISAFTSLDTLICANNSISSIDLTSNTQLKFLWCSANPPLALLNITANTDLRWLGCSGTGLTTINLSTNTLLNYLSLQSSQFTSLDVRANTYLGSLACQNSPNLSVVCLTTAQYNLAINNPNGWTKDAGCSWSTSCAVGIDEFSKMNEKKVIHIFNSLGQKVNAVNDIGVYIYQYSDGSTQKIAKAINY